jgi:hypothetical protein
VRPSPLPHPARRWRWLLLPLLWPAPGHAATPVVVVTVDNPLPLARPAETVAVALRDLRVFAPDLDPRQAVVKDAKGALRASQWVDTDGDEAMDEVVFQVDLGPRQSATFQITTGIRPPPTRADFQAFGRFVREAYDDFAWENDRVAHRVYGAGRETRPKAPLTASGIEVWCKVKGALVINDWYLVGDAEGLPGGACPPLRAGPGVGGTALRDGEAFAPSRNFTRSRIYANGPIRLVFELDYAPWSANGTLVAERKRITLDAGAYFNVAESSFRWDGKGRPPVVGVGLAKPPRATLELDGKQGLLRGWTPLGPGTQPAAGFLGTVVLADPKRVVGVQDTATEAWLVANDPDTPLRYAFGSAWSKGGGPKSAAAWKRYVANLRERFLVPVEIRISAGGKTAP